METGREEKKVRGQEEKGRQVKWNGKEEGQKRREVKG